MRSRQVIPCANQGRDCGRTPAQCAELQQRLERMRPLQTHSAASETDSLLRTPAQSSGVHRRAGNLRLYRTDSLRGQNTGGGRAQAQLHSLPEGVRLLRSYPTHGGRGANASSEQLVFDSEGRFPLQEPMTQKQCPHCSSELVRAKRADLQGVPVIAHAASPGWRCSVCGGEFTTAQIRANKRAKSVASEHA